MENERFYELDGTVLSSYHGREEAPQLPEGITGIGMLAFADNEDVLQVRIPETVTDIGDYAFDECLYLARVDLPAGLKTIGESAFRCAAIRTIDLPAGLEKLRGDAFYACPLHHITIPGSIGTVEYTTFYECSSLKRVVLEEGIHTIDTAAFGQCTALEEITIPDSVQQISRTAFIGCANLREVHASENWMREHPRLLLRILASTEYCGDLIAGIDPALAYCMEDGVLTYYLGHEEDLVIDPNWGVREIGPYALAYREGLRSVQIPEGVRTIGKGAFCCCVGLERVQLPESLQQIGEEAFSYCGIHQLRLPGGLQQIGENAFRRSELEELVIPGGVAQICEGTASNCRNLRRVELLPGVRQVNVWAFSHCCRLQEVVIPDSADRIHPESFANSPVRRFRVSDHWKRTHPDAYRYLMDYSIRALKKSIL